jgi:hypothetical protein
MIAPLSNSTSKLTLTNTSRRASANGSWFSRSLKPAGALNRSFALEAAVFSQISADAEEGAPVPGHLENLLKYEKTLKNLHLQEARLDRRFDKDLAELRELQQTRKREEMLATSAASPAGPLDPKLGSNLQMLKDMLEHDGFKLPNGSKSPNLR